MATKHRQVFILEDATKEAPMVFLVKKNGRSSSLGSQHFDSIHSFILSK